jgi:hypothetical protein
MDFSRKEQMNGSINARFALNPESILSEDDVSLALNRLGLDRGRVLSAFPELWEQHLLQHSKSLSTRTQKRIEIELVRLKGQLLSEGLRYDASKTWDLNARDEISKNNLSAAISTDGVTPPLLSLKSLTEEDLERISPRTVSVKASIENYLEILYPMLMTSEKVHYVDPFFDLTSGSYSKVFDAIFKSARTTKARHWVFYTRYLVKSSMKVKDERENELILKSFLPSGHSCTVSFFDDSGSEQKLHQRAIFTKFTGFEFQIGLQNKPKEVYPISRIATSLRDNLTELFVHNGHNFRRVKKFVVEA